MGKSYGMSQASIDGMKAALREKISLQNGRLLLWKGARAEYERYKRQAAGRKCKSKEALRTMDVNGDNSWVDAAQEVYERKGKPYGSEFKTIIKESNIKFVKAVDGAQKRQWRQ